MQDGKGYLIPEPIDPGQLRCVQVWIPDDIFYYVAFMGAYQFFSTWTAWEKDGTTRAKQAADVWKAAFAYTLEQGTECEGSEMDYEDLINAIEACCSALNNSLANIVTSNNGIANAIQNLRLEQSSNFLYDCVPCEDRPPINDPDPDPDPDPENPPVGGDPSGWESYLCRAIQYLYDGQVDEALLTAYGQMSIAGGLLSASGLLIILASTGVGAPVAAVSALVLILAAAYQADEIFEIQQDVADMRQDIVCLLYNASGTESALSALNDYLENYNYQSGFTQGWIDGVLNNAYVLNQLYNGEISVPESYDGDNINCEFACIPGAVGSAWYPEDTHLDSEASDYTFQSENRNAFRISGYLETDDTTALEWRCYNDYDHTELTAVTFLIEELSYTWAGAPSPQMSYGAPNQPTNIIEFLEGESVCIHLNTESPAPGAWDHVIAVNNVDYLDGMFKIEEFTFQPPPVTVNLKLSFITLWDASGPILE